MSVQKGQHKVHERDHAHKHEADFRITARRNKLLGLWAATKMAMPEEQHESYAKQVVSADLDEPGDEDVIRKVMNDFAAHNVPVTREEIVEVMHRLVAEARAQLQGS